jgi:hypothetical protein
MIKAWMKRLFKRKESDDDKWERYKKALSENLDNIEETGKVHKLCRKLEDELNIEDATKAKLTVDLEHNKYLGMLGQGPRFITVAAKFGSPVYLDPYKAIKAMYCGDKKIWQNPDYEKGGRYYE